MARTSAQTRVLTDPEEIRRWAEERGAKPARVKGTGGADDVGIIRLDFPGYSGEDTLEEISWDDWFKKFEESDLALLVQDTTARGQKSNFNKLVSRETLNEREDGRSRSSRSEARASASTASSGRSQRGRSNRSSSRARTTRNRKASPTSARRASSRNSASSRSSRSSRTSGSRPATTRGQSRKPGSRRSGTRANTRVTGRAAATAKKASGRSSSSSRRRSSSSQKRAA